MNNDVRQRIEQRLARGETVVVYPSKKRGSKPRVSNLEKAVKMMRQPGIHQPWTHRSSNKQTPDPLGAVDRELPGPLDRKHMYEEGD